MKRFSWLLLCAAWLSAPARADPALWVVQSPTARIFLFGTMHILPRKADWLSPEIASAFDQSAVLMEEADVGLTDPARAQRIMAQAVSPDIDLWRALSPDRAAKFRAQVRACGLPDVVVGHFRPWFAAMLPTICGLMADADHPLDTRSSSPEAALVRRAKEQGKRLAFFETAEQQIGYLSGASEAAQMSGLRQSIDQGSADAEDFSGMEKAWLAGDVGAIAALVTDSRRQDPQSYDTIFLDRNRRFAARILELLRGHDTVFVAIGAGHLAGPDSVQAQLAAAHVNARRM